MAGIAGVLHPAGSHASGGEWRRRMGLALEPQGGGRELAFEDREALLLDGTPRHASTKGGRASSDGVTVVLHGEIYNEGALATELFRSKARPEASDAAGVLIELYRSRGPDMVSALNGAFAFALWDAGQRRLLLGRDRLGEIPLFYAEIGETLIFGSNLRSVLAYPGVRRDVDFRALDAYFTYQYVPPPMTVFEAIRWLPAGHVLIRDDAGSRLHRYWELSFGSKLNLTEDEYCEEILGRLERATRLRTADGEHYAAYLSGGTDSSLVVATLQRVRPGSVEAFTVGAHEEALSDIGYARAVADLWKVPHHVLEITPRMIEVLPQLVWQFGEPFADSSVLPTYFASLAIRQRTDVAFCGDGADESFGGYLLYMFDRQSRYSRYLAIPQSVRRAMAALSATMPDSASAHYYAPLRRAKRFTTFLAMSPERRYVELLSNFTGWSKRLLYAGALRTIPARAAPDLFEQQMASSDATELVDRFLALDLATYLPGDILPKFDIATTAAGLAVRSPFLDHELVEFAASIPADLKVRGTMNKYILKEAATRRIPRDLIYRPKKGFSLPVEAWLRGPWQHLVRELLLSPVAMSQNFVNPEYVRAILEEHAAGVVDHSVRIWILLNFEVWCRTFLDGRPEKSLSWEEMLGREVGW